MVLETGRTSCQMHQVVQLIYVARYGMLYGDMLTMAFSLVYTAAKPEHPAVLVRSKQATLCKLMTAVSCLTILQEQTCWQEKSCFDAAIKFCVCTKDLASFYCGLDQMSTAGLVSGHIASCRHDRTACIVLPVAGRSKF